jgi:site-specific DNA-adenine methylase
MKSKLSAFIDRIQERTHEGRMIITNSDFRQFDLTALTEKSLVYCDPPYLIACAAYNEQDGWNERTERDLHTMLDCLNERNIRFALSNILSSKGKTNAILSGWLNQRDYRVIHLLQSYANSNYQTKNRTSSTDEVLIINY